MSFFRPPKMPSAPAAPAVKLPEPLPPPPERSAADTSALATRQRSEFFRRGGRASTMLTGGLGADGGVSAVRFLGTAART